MARERSSRISAATRMFRGARTTPCWITRSSRPGCICPPFGEQRRPESQTTRTLNDCPEVPVGKEGTSCRVVVATHPKGATKSRVGVTREETVYELFFTTLPQQSFTVVDIVELYLHRGAFEPAL